MRVAFLELLLLLPAAAFADSYTIVFNATRGTPQGRMRLALLRGVERG
jgi:hypothetical protein